MLRWQCAALAGVADIHARKVVAIGQKRTVFLTASSMTKLRITCDQIAGACDTRYIVEK